MESTYKLIVSATDGLGGARRTTSHTEDGDRATAKPDETCDVGKIEPEQSTELAERCGVGLKYMLVNAGNESTRNR